jgi:ribosomal protein S18 acetylase RimI-like enzyme
MNILEINQENIYYLEDFIKKPLSNNFRYFQKRDINCTKNHLVTLIGLINNEPIAYGHIDYSQEENKYWLGICVLNDYQGKGYGKQIMQELINKSETKKIIELYLSVDKNNNAIYLYKKFDFKIIDEKPNLYFMKKNLNLF